eukprot:2965058-Prymnesium_polylepis.2
MQHAIWRSWGGSAEWSWAMLWMCARDGAERARPMRASHERSRRTYDSSAGELALDLATISRVGGDDTDGAVHDHVEPVAGIRRCLVGVAQTHLILGRNDTVAGAHWLQRLKRHAKEWPHELQPSCCLKRENMFDLRSGQAASEG